jgi:hypothetical protein
MGSLCSHSGKSDDGRRLAWKNLEFYRTHRLNKELVLRPVLQLSTAQIPAFTVFGLFSSFCSSSKTTQPVVVFIKMHLAK